jgi:hypothetical protein
MISCEGSWTAFREKTIVKGILRYFRLERGEYRGFGLGFSYRVDSPATLASGPNPGCRVTQNLLLL